MLLTGLVLTTLCSVVRGSGFVPAAGPIPAPVVTAASSQYFERTFNRLVAAAPVQPIVPVVPAPPVIVHPVNPVNQVPVNPQPSAPSDTNIAIAIAHAAAPVATILLPPFPFGPPPGYTFIQPSAAPDTKEPTTQKATTVTTTTQREPEATTPVPSNVNNIGQALPSNENANFQQYFAPPLPLPINKPQKLKTSVEVVPVPLTYIAPPPIQLQQIKAVKHYYHAYVPSKIIIRPVRVRTVRVPARLIIHSAPVSIKKASSRYKQSRGPVNLKVKEPTTLRPYNRPLSKPPRL